MGYQWVASAGGMSVRESSRATDSPWRLFSCRCCSSRRGQDRAKCRDCACVIYSVEQDFRQQEGRLRRVLTSLGAGTPSQRGSPATPRPSQPPRGGGEARKTWRRCFWFL
ncbi:protein INSYN2B-like [Sceloporus undulatus]|uniref:protein INSYN2B-like n=1 Tax=Sceloporus undulatus TaxID=8520 RepID=UPI001C4C0FEC|nr:protein INSYN2B-like [Sceloporus undulatus]